MLIYQFNQFNCINIMEGSYIYINTVMTSFRVELRFVIGSHGCPVPVEDRDDEFSCVQWKAEVPGQWCLVLSTSTRDNHNQACPTQHKIEIVL